MKKLFAILIVLCFSLCSDAQRNIDVLHYSYQLDLTDIDDSIYGRAVITYVLKKSFDCSVMDAYCTRIYIIPKFRCSFDYGSAGVVLQHYIRRSHVFGSPAEHCCGDAVQKDQNM